VLHPREQRRASLRVPAPLFALDSGSLDGRSRDRDGEREKGGYGYGDRENSLSGFASGRPAPCRGELGWG